MVINLLDMFVELTLEAFFLFFQEEKASTEHLGSFLV